MIDIYTDGSCRGNPGPGAAAFVVLKNNRVEYEKALPYPKATNNAMELVAFNMALNYALSHNIIECRIYSDSKYVTEGILKWMDKWVGNGWVGSNGHKIKNLQIWMDAYELWNALSSVCNTSVEYVEGHADDPMNNYVDKLAKRTVNEHFKK